METHYLGGYYLIKTVPIEYWDGKNTVIRSCSSCFNVHAFGYWSSNWKGDNSFQKKIQFLSSFSKTPFVFTTFQHNTADTLNGMSI